MSRRLVLVASSLLLALSACAAVVMRPTSAASRITIEPVVSELPRLAHEQLVEQQRVADVKRQNALRAAQDAQRATQAPSQHSAPTTTPAKRSGALSVGPDDAFWRRLSQCESPNGSSGTFAGYFQFSSDTAKRVGYRAGESYDEQLAQAKTWLGMIGGDGGSKSGWPHCWWVALRG